MASLVAAAVPAGEVGQATPQPEPVTPSPDLNPDANSSCEQAAFCASLRCWVLLP